MTDKDIFERFKSTDDIDTEEKFLEILKKLRVIVNADSPARGKVSIEVKLMYNGILIDSDNSCAWVVDD